MTPLQELEQKIRNSIPELKEEYEAFEDGSIDRDMITQIMLNHVLEYFKNFVVCIYQNGEILYEMQYYLCTWNLKSAYLKDQSEELINVLNKLR